MPTDQSLQERYAPTNACFGCGPANAQGLRIRSFEEGDTLVARWAPQPHHEAFPGVLNGGIIGALLDCHSNWASINHFMKARELDKAPCCVTAEYAITLKRPCPSKSELEVWAKVVETQGDRCIVEGEIVSEGKVRATCRGTFVAVGPGHPAYHRW